jgi:eukaryotic-like serine/threonine-protein kinase
VPSVVEKTRAQAVKALEKVGLKADITLQNSADTPKGVVMTQDPPGATLVDKGTKVDLTVSAGRKTVQIPPDIVDMNRQDAEAALRDLGLEPNSVEDTSSNETRGQVTGTKPLAGETVPVGSTVTVYYSAGLVEVPRVIDSTEVDATNLLEGLGFQVTSSYQPSSDQAAGTVIAQDPRAGKKVAYGSQVVIFVSLATPTPTETTTTPTTTDTETDTETDTPSPRQSQPTGTGTATFPSVQRSPS